ncbi:hypothetical protein RI844_10170 [Thalassotalea fonticola]|uniref:PKD/Chitinase domain-containing protein n=1 Tax=Thalassotalea fonticola TaxID=3065649 RepID=A0ABZ0GIX5_9GAMM|nr:hypothetical protein RI844_10170 [Colwelliaceae bacterium S1-1]
MKNIVKPVMAIALCSSLVACGGSSGKGTPAETPNQAPIVSAGEDQSITLPDGTIHLAATVTDDNSFTVLWTQESGPTSISFSTQSATDTNVVFSKSGTYTLKLTADDGDFTVSDDVVITVNSNQAPVVMAGIDQSIAFPNNTVNLAATVNDDGNYSALWTKVSGPGNVIFSNAFSDTTSAEFSDNGAYTLRLTVDDGEFIVNDDVEITVNSNQAPVVIAGIDQSISFPNNIVNLAATVNYDGSYTTLWTKASGSGSVIFTNEFSENTSAEFSQSGIYTLRLTVDDGEFVVSDDVVITVESDFDSFGISKLYKTATGFIDWESTAWDNGFARTIYGRDYSDTTGWSQKRGDDVLEIDGNGIMEMGGGNQPRIYINPYSGSEEVNPDQFFKNIEATVYYKRIGTDGATNGGLVIGLRSGPNGHSDSGDYCDATTYYARFRHDGDWDFYKELKHADGARANVASLFPGNLPSEQWIGMKFIAYNINNDSNVKLEVYIDKTSNGDVTNGGEWTLVGEMIDDGSWSVPEDVSSCTYSDNHIITTGGGTVLIRNTGVLSAEYKYFSVREIDANIN